MKYAEQKLIIFATGFLFALAWSWLPWLTFNGILLVTGIFPPVGMFGYYIMTMMTWGAAAAVFERKANEGQ